MSTEIHIVLCECNRASTYAKGRCFRCYREWWRRNTDRPITHGKPYSYTTRGCRCSECYAAVKAMNARAAARRAEG